MSRKEVSSTFTDGLVSDLNPINTPNTVLTDCLNGTIITYDGNEYMLQNDKGNFPLSNCKLHENYIPVGIKEYGDILYIVSYNPLDKYVEIGSYPSPKNVNDSNSTPGLELHVKSIQDQIKDLFPTDPSALISINYSDITNNMERLEFFYGSNPEGTKLNPGDKYKLQIDGTNKCKYEELEYYVIDENRKTYNISDKIDINSSDFKHIKWNIPGWIGIRPRFANIDDLKINVKKLVSKAYSNNLELSLNFQILASDPILMEHLTPNLSDIYVKFTITDGSGSILKTETINLVDYIEYNNDTFIYRANWPANEPYDISDASIINIKAEPILRLNINNRNVDIVYDKCVKTLTLNLSQKGDPKQLKIGVNSWWYRTDSESKSLTLKFDTMGLDNASVLSEDVFLSYSIYRVKNNPISLVDSNLVEYEPNKPYKEIPLDDWNLLGETIIEFPLMEFNEDNYTTYPNRFYPEDIYIFEFKFWEDPECTKTLEGASVFRKLVVASELMNDFEDACYDKITFDRWMSKFPSSIKNKKFIVENLDVDTNNVIIDTEATTDESYNIWTTDNNWSKYKTFKSAINDEKLQNFTISAGATVPCLFSVKTAVQSLVGPLWSNLLEKSNLECKISLDNKQFRYREFNLDKYTGSNNTSKTINKQIKAYKQETYTLDRITEPRELWDYTSNNLIIPINRYQINLKYRHHTENGYDGYMEMVFCNPQGTKEGDKDCYEFSHGTWMDLLSIGNKMPKSILNFFRNPNNDSDALLVNVTIYGESFNEGDHSKLIRCQQPWNGIYEYTGIYGTNGENLTSNTISFIVLKNKEEVLFSKIDDSNIAAFNAWKDNVTYIKCSQNKIYGSFYKANDSVISTVDNLRKLKLEGKMQFRSFKFREIDLLSSNRENIDSQTNSNNFKISEESTNNFISINPIVFSTYEEDLVIPEDILTNVDSVLNPIKSKISLYNIEVDKDKVAISDPVYNNENLKPGSNYYMYNDNDLSHQTLIDALNEKVNTTDSNLLVWNCRVKHGGISSDSGEMINGFKLGIDLGDFSTV